MISASITQICLVLKQVKVQFGMQMTLFLSAILNVIVNRLPVNRKQIQSAIYFNAN